MNQELMEWLLLLGRWLHITVAICWIGNSIFFMWLDRTLQFDPNSTKSGHLGSLWMVHGGGFYHVEKLQMGPTKAPSLLHWFKWESYWTWMSGLFLVLMIFYTGGGSFLLDSSVSGISYWMAVLISISSIVGSWLFYDFLWESRLARTNSIWAHALTILWLGGMAYFLCHTLSGRAAYIHIGAMLGTWMTANVFLRIIPRQVKMVEASKSGEPVNTEWSKNAKSRSTHNTYFTLPVIFLMLSNHFPSTYGNRYNWIILLALCLSGALIREFFISRLQNQKRALGFLFSGVVIILVTILFSRENDSSAKLSIENSVPVATQNAIAPEAGNTFGIKGTVTFTGEVPRGEKLLLPLPCAQKFSGDVYSNEVIVNDGRLKNVLVRITKGLEGQHFSDIPAESVVMDQRGCLYEPRVAAARVGQKVEFLNSDELFHNVRSLTNLNESFNEAMPKKYDRLVKVFSKPELFVQTKCSVHPWMNAYIAIMDHPFYSISNSAGEFQIKNLPDGDYTIEAWHEVFGSQTQNVRIGAKETKTVNFEFRK